MSVPIKSIWMLVASILQRLAALALLLAAMALVGATLAAAFGLLPWLALEARFRDVVYENAGQIAQIGLTVLMVLLCANLPANARIMALEISHRRFNLGMQDVARAVLPELGIEETLRDDGTVVDISRKAAE